MWPQVGATSSRRQGRGLSLSRQLAPHPAPQASDECQGHTADKGDCALGGCWLIRAGTQSCLSRHGVNSSRDPRARCRHPGGLPEPEPVTATLVEAEKAGRLWRVVVKGLEGLRNGTWTGCQAGEV